MSIVIEQYTRKPFDIEAIRVDQKNMDEIAKWCGGSIQEVNGKRRYIKVDVNTPLTEKQTKAYVGDWVLKGGSGFKVYTHKAFLHCFDKVENKEAENQLPLFEAPKSHVPTGYPEPSTR